MRKGGLQVPSLNWVKAIFSYGFQLRWNNFSRLSFWQWFFNVVGILLVLKKGEALLSSNICFHHLFRARTRVVLKKVFQNSCSFISFHTHLGKVVEFRAIIFLDAWSFADFKTFIFQTFGSLLFFSHIFDYNLPPLCPRYPCCLLSPLFLAEQYIIIAGSLVCSAANINDFQEQGYSNRRENKRWLTLTIVKGTITALGTVVILAKLLIWAPDWFLEKATHVYTQTFPHKHRERESIWLYTYFLTEQRKGNTTL